MSSYLNGLFAIVPLVIEYVRCIPGMPALKGIFQFFSLVGILFVSLIGATNASLSLSLSRSAVSIVVHSVRP